MRVLVSETDEDFSFEFILSAEDFDKLLVDEPLSSQFKWDYEYYRVLNIEIRKEKEFIMPLVKGKKAASKKGFSENVEREMHEGKPQKQAVAIAYSEARQGKKDAKKKAK